jgi:hypothetical protein
MTRLAIAILAATLAASSARAQGYITQPLDYQNPGAGSVTITPNGTYFTQPLDYGHPEAGSITVLPNGAPYQYPPPTSQQTD